MRYINRTYEQLRSIVREGWLRRGNSLDARAINDGLRVISAGFDFMGVRETLANPLSQNEMLEGLLNAALAGEWDDVDAILDDLFRKHLMAVA